MWTKSLHHFLTFPLLRSRRRSDSRALLCITHTAEDYDDDDVIKGGIKQGERAESPIVGTRKFTEKSLDEEESEDERLKAFPG